MTDRYTCPYTGLTSLRQTLDFKRSAQIATSVLIEELTHFCRIELVSSEENSKIFIYSTLTDKEQVCAILSFAQSEVEPERPALMVFLSGRDSGAVMESIAKAMWTVCGSKPMSPIVLKHLQRAEEERSLNCGQTR